MSTLQKIIVVSGFFIGLIGVRPGPVGADPYTNLFFKNTADYEKIRIKRVVSADTIVLENDERIKLIGLKAPEAPRRKKRVKDRDNKFKYEFEEEVVSPFSTIEEQAFDFAKSLLEGKTVRLEFDHQKRDQDFLNLAYVFLIEDDVFANAKILSEGFARLHISPPNTKYAQQLREAYVEARNEKRGLQGSY